MPRLQRILIVLLAAVGVAAAQATSAAVATPAPGPQSQTASHASPWFFYSSAQAQSNRYGQAYVWSNTLGYRVSPRVAVLAGVPYYSFHMANNAGGVSGFGDAYLALQVLSSHDRVRLVTTLTGTAPTGNRTAGLSSRRATVDFDNRVNVAYGRLVPFLDLGIANTITNETFLVQPVTSYGWVGHAQAGGNIYLTHRLAVGAAAYGVFPLGTQNVYSRGISPLNPSPTPGQSGGASLDRDHGYGVWVLASPIPWFQIQASFSRSHSPLGSRSGVMGSWLGSLYGKKACWAPLLSITCRK